MAYLEAALLIKSVLEKEARERSLSNLKRDFDRTLEPEILPDRKGDTRDKLGEMLNMLM